LIREQLEKENKDPYERFIMALVFSRVQQDQRARELLYRVFESALELKIKKKWPIQVKKIKY